LLPFQIPVRTAFGAWWDHGMSDQFEDCLNEGADWIITMDYDSIFTSDHVNALLYRFATSLEIDALAALQCRRLMNESPLWSGADFRGKDELQITGDAIRVDSAHFGLTVFRADALRKVAKPWFLHEPDKDGSYKSDGRTDPDLYFWRKWREAGNTCYVDPLFIPGKRNIGIGHLQAMVSEFTRTDGNVIAPRHEHWLQWRKDNRPRTESAVAA
jgi:hypothetical protein